MKRFLAVAAVALAPVVATSCNDYNIAVQPNTGAAISFLSPADATAGGPNFTLTVSGNGFVDKTVVQWKGQNLVTTPVKDSSGNVSATVITAAVPAALIANPAKALVNTLNPHKGGTDNGLSNSLAFFINPPGNPVPAITSISPASVPACSATCADFTLIISGSDFVPTSDPSGGSSVRWNNGPSQSTLTVSSATFTEIQVTVPGNFIANPGTAVVTVYNPPSSSGGAGGGSNGEIFSICTSTCP